MSSIESSMDRETLTALRGSIAKWQCIVCEIDIDQGTSNCPLCLRFHSVYRGKEGNVLDDGEKGCTGCPVNYDGEHYGCAETPYDDYELASDGGDTESMAEAARAELDFLISLLPAGETP